MNQICLSAAFVCTRMMLNTLLVGFQVWLYYQKVRKQG